METQEWEAAFRQLIHTIRDFRDNEQRADVLVNYVRDNFIAKSTVEKVLGEMKKQTCDCDEDPGYHSKDCDLTPFGYNQCLDDVRRALQ